MRLSTFLMAFTATATIAAPTSSTNELVARQDLLSGLSSFLPFDLSSLTGGAPAPAADGSASAGSFLSSLPFVGGIFQMLGLKYTDIPADSKFTPEVLAEIETKLRALYPVA